MDFTHHEEVGLHERVYPLFIKSEGGARETGDEHDDRFGRVTGRLCPNLGAVRGSYIDGHSGRGKRIEGGEGDNLYRRPVCGGWEELGTD